MRQDDRVGRGFGAAACDLPFVESGGGLAVTGGGRAEERSGIAAIRALRRGLASWWRGRSPRATDHVRRFAWAMMGVAVVGGVPRAQGQDAVTSAQNVQAGARLFLSKGCLSCHAADGRGTGPDLRRLQSAASFYGFAATLWNHLPQMQASMMSRGVAIPELKPSEAGDLVAYLFWLEYFDAPGDAKRGAELFVAKACVRCHQVRGVGGVFGPDLDQHAVGSPVMLAAAMWNHLPVMMEQRAAQGLRHSGFTASEFRDVIAHIEGPERELPRDALFVTAGQADRGRRVFDEKRCGACHRVRGIGGDVGPDLGRDVVYASVLDFAAALWNKGPEMITAMRRQGIVPPSLSPQEMADLVGFFYAGRYFGDGGRSDRGRQLVNSGRCGGCHRTVDLPGPRGLASPASVLASLWNHILREVPLGQQSGAWPRLSAEDAADIAAYLLAVGGRR